MQQPIQCIIVDDDEIDRLTTQSFIKKATSLEIIGTYADAETAIAGVMGKMPDVAFLDVDMAGMSGLELRRELNNIPACVFITSYPDYAVESFELAALDFIVKPIKADRFAKTIERITEFFTIRNKAQLLDHTLGADTIFIKDGYEQVKLQLHDIIYLEALKDYTSIVTPASKYCILCSLGNLLKEPGFQSFIRIHKSYAIQKNYINRIKAQEVVVKNIALPIGRAYKDALAAFK